MKITVFGIGFVGAASALLLANCNEVCAVDIDKYKVDTINRGLSPVSDEGMKALLERGGLSITATSNTGEAIKDADYVIIAIPTDYAEEIEGFDMSGLEQLLDNITASESRATIVIRSTVGVGYTEKLGKKYPGHTFLFVPEFLREKSAMADAIHPDRIIIGYDLNDQNANDRAKEFSGIMLKSITACAPDTAAPPVLLMSLSEAEAVKLFSNTYLAMRVAFYNELDSFSEVSGMDAARIIEGVSLDKRIGNYYNRPGFGYGGYCLPKDTKMLNSCFSDSALVHSIPESNRKREGFIAERIMTEAGYLPDKKTNPLIGLYRLTESPESDNLRGSTMLDILQIMRKEKLRIMIYEPLLKDISELPDFEDGGSDDPESAVVLLENDLKRFRDACDIIAANRFDENLEDVKEKVYTRDTYNRNER